MRKLPCLLAALFISAPAFADTHVSYTRPDGSPGMQLYVKDGAVRMESGAGQSIGVFDTRANSLLVLVPGQKKYYLFDEQTAAHLSAQFQDAENRLKDARDKLESKSEKLADKATTLAQHGLLQTLVGHALIDYAIELMIPTDFSMKMELKDLGSDESVAGFACHDEQVIISGNPGETRCVAKDTSKLGIPTADLATLQTMSDDYKQILTAIEPMAPGITATMPTGLPVRSQKLAFDMATKKLSTTLDTLKAINTGALSADLFRAPADYTRASLDQIQSPGSY